MGFLQSWSDKVQKTQLSQTSPKKIIVINFWFSVGIQAILLSIPMVDIAAKRASRTIATIDFKDAHNGNNSQLGSLCWFFLHLAKINS